jgi:hypothetical protein
MGTAVRVVHSSFFCRCLCVGTVPFPMWFSPLVCAFADTPYLPQPLNNACPTPYDLDDAAPITAGTFASNVISGEYDGASLSATQVAVLAGDETAGANAPIPLEMLAAGDFEPTYRTPLDVRSGELPVLPLSIYGAVAMARLPDYSGIPPGFVSGHQFVIYLFDKRQAGLAGLSFDEGEFGVMGYVTQGAEALARLGQGDVVVSAKLVEGLDRLVPAGATAGVEGEAGR